MKKITFKIDQMGWYHIWIVVLTLISTVNVVLLTYLHWGDATVEKGIADVTLFYFAIDYFVRLGLSKNRKTFLIESAFDMMGIIPMHPVFALFRLERIVRIIRYHHLLWHLGLDGKWTRDFHRFIYDTGFIYLFTISVVIICLSALSFSIFEHRDFAESLWWAITTATTVGYGDETPKTAGGKVIAMFLMLGGVGFIGLLTSTITGFFTRDAEKPDVDTDTRNQEDLQLLIKKIDQLTHKVDHLQQKVDYFEVQHPAKKHRKP